MKNLTKNMSLLDLERKFEEEITSEDIRIIGDLNISYEDYITIREKINKLMDLYSSCYLVEYKKLIEEIRRKKYDSRFNELFIRSWCSFWTPKKKMESKDERIHL